MFPKTAITLLTLLALTVGSASAQSPFQPGIVWQESETGTRTVAGTWTWDAARKQFVARWENGAQGFLTVVSYNGRTIVLRRNDPTGSAAGMVADYVGQINGNSIRGTVTWRDFKRKTTRTGPWAANFGRVSPLPPFLTPGAVWQESETGTRTVAGTWTWDAARKQFVARWENGAQGFLTVVSYNGRTIVLRRNDPTGSAAGMVADYVGQINGNSIRGTVTWRDLKRKTTRTGPWVVNMRPSGTSKQITQVLQEKGAHTGAVQVSLHWNTKDDLDLHVICPSGEEIYFGHRRSRCHGQLDVDANASSATATAPAVENVFWPHGQAPKGHYKIYVDLYRKSNPAQAAVPTAFSVRLAVHGQIRMFNGSVTHSNPAHRKVLVHAFDVN